MTIQASPLCLWNTFEWECGHICSRAKRLQTRTFMLSNEDLYAFERGHSRVRIRTFTRLNENLHVFERAPSCVGTRAFTRWNKDPHTLEQGPSRVRTTPGWVHFACGMCLPYTLYLVSDGYCTFVYSKYKLEPEMKLYFPWWSASDWILFTFCIIFSLRGMLNDFVYFLYYFLTSWNVKWGGGTAPGLKVTWAGRRDASFEISSLRMLVISASRPLTHTTACNTNVILTNLHPHAYENSDTC